MAGKISMINGIMIQAIQKIISLLILLISICKSIAYVTYFLADYMGTRKYIKIEHDGYKVKYDPAKDRMGEVKYFIAVKNRSGCR